MSYRTEVDLAKDVIAWLIGQGFECFQEVVVGNARGPVDIVAVRGREVWAIECKLTLSWDLLAQARQHVDYATKTFIATPWVRDGFDAAITKDDICAHLKLNRLICNTYHIGTKLHQYTNPNPNVDYFLHALKPEHRTTGIAGSKAGTAHTPFKSQVASAVAEFVKSNPGCTFKQIAALESVREYYKGRLTSAGAIRKYIANGIIKHVRVESDHGKFTYWPFNPAEEPRI